MKKSLLLLFSVALLAALAMTSCSSSEDEPQKISLDKGQSTNLSLAANSSGGQVNFTAAASWSAWVSSISSGAPEDVEWLHLDTTHGEAGSVVVSFRLDRNRTGQSRTAYIIIICEDSRVVLTITQTAEEDGDEPLPDVTVQKIEIFKTNYIYHDGNAYEDGEEHYVLHYNGDRLRDYTADWRDDIDNGPGQQDDDYCENHEVFDLNWESEAVTAFSNNQMYYRPSGKYETSGSRHSAQFKYIETGERQITAGSYKWDEDGMQTDYEVSYDNNGYVTEVRNNDATTHWTAYRFKWSDGNMVGITSTEGTEITIKYADDALVNVMKTFDLNWVLPTEIEGYDFAAGDITRLFASIGCMGKPSRLLMTEIVSKNNDDTEHYSMTYTRNSNNEVTVRVDVYYNGNHTSHSVWNIHFEGAII